MFGGGGGISVYVVFELDRLAGGAAASRAETPRVNCVAQGYGNNDVGNGSALRNASATQFSL